MDRRQVVSGLAPETARLFEQVTDLHGGLRAAFTQQFQRNLPFGDELFDRWERARYLGFGDGSSIYESVYVLGDVKVGAQTWVGPFVMLDGSGGLSIGNYCMISTGVHVYTHDTVKWALTAGKVSAERAPVRIEDCCYIGSQAMVIKGVTVGHHSVVGACALVNRSLPPHSISVGIPARVIGRTEIDGDTVRLTYFDKPVPA